MTIPQDASGSYYVLLALVDVITPSNVYPSWDKRGDKCDEQRVHGELEQFERSDGLSARHIHQQQRFYRLRLAQ
jgi:hypothetical protein